MGFEAIAAGNGKEALEKAIAEKPNLVLLDILMPDMDGRETARLLRANPETREIPILAETALSRPRDLSSCLEAGCNDYLVKPFTFKDLQEKLRRWV